MQCQVENFWRLFRTSEKHAPYLIAQKIKAAWLKIGHTDQICQYEVAVKTHEWIEVDDKAHENTDGSQNKNSAAHGAIRQEGP